MSSIIVTNKGNSTYVIERNDTFKTVEIQFNNVDRSVVDIIARTMQSGYTNGSGTSTWEFGLAHLHAAGPSAGPIIIDGFRLASRLIPSGTIGGTFEPSNGGINQVSRADARAFADGIVYEQYANMPRIEIAVNGWDRLWSTAGFISKDAAVAFTIFAEIPHIFIREKISAMGGHGEKLTPYVSSPETFNGFKPSDNFYDDVDFVNIDMADAAGLFAPNGGRESYLRLRARSESQTETARLLSNKLLMTPEERAAAIRKIVSAGGSSVGGRKYEMERSGNEFILRLKGVAEAIVNIDGGQLGSALGSVLGRRLTSDPFGQIIASATLSTVLGAVGELIDERTFNQKSTLDIVNGAEGSFGDALLLNVKGAGIGALSSYLTAELFDSVGIGGVPGELGQSVVGGYVSAIINNLDGLLGNTKQLKDVLSGVNVPLLIGSFLGTKLAKEIYSPGTVGGQIGSAVGALYGGYAATVALGAAAKLAGGVIASAANPALAFAVANPIAAVAIVAAVVLIDTLLGGLIGSVFGGTPRSGADVVWDPDGGKFESADAYSRKGGSKDAAVQISQAVANSFNAVLAATGSKLLDPIAVQGGNYGMRMKDYVYRPSHTRDKDAITARFKGRDGAAKLIEHGVFLGLSDMMGQMGGGDTYVKRAVASNLANTGGNSDSNFPGAAGDFDFEALLGDMTVAQDYRAYLQSSVAINALIAADPETPFSAGWVVTLARVVELGLHRRSSTDWVGGYALWMDEASDNAVDGQSLTPDHFTAAFDQLTNARYWTVSGANGELRGYVEDTIEAGDLDVVTGTAGADTIRLSGIMLGASTATENVDLNLNGVAFSGAAYTIDVAAFVDAGEGDDLVYASDRGDNVLGGAGNDRLIGGKLDDWLFGGDGNDDLYAGAVDPTGDFTQKVNADGGSGNFLDGGAGADDLYGSKGSDWLVGGDGMDDLYGGPGGDILDAGPGNGDEAKGHAGSDQYIFRRGDGQDIIFDYTEDYEPSTTTTDPISVRVKARIAGTEAKTWAGDGEFTVDGSTKGGEDALVFGEGITLRDLMIERGTKTENGAIVPNNNLIIRVQSTTTDANGNATESWDPATGDQITIRNWFNGTRKIEWLRFSNGDELRIGDIVGFLKGTSGSDVIVGTTGKDFIYGLEGDDKLFGLSNNDFVAGGLGNDLVSGNDDEDMVLGGENDDVVLGGLGQDFVTGDGGNDRVYGGANNDILSGGRGDDLIVTGSGTDLVKYSRGDGRDIVFDEYAGTWETAWQNGSYINGYSVDGFGNVSKSGVPIGAVAWDGHWDYNEQGGVKSLKRLIAPGSGPKTLDSGSSDSIEFDVGIDPDDIVFQREGADLRIGITAPGTVDSRFENISDQIRLSEWYVTPARGIEHLSFIAVGKIDISEAATGRQIVAGTDGSDTLAASPNLAAWITGGVGDDLITGSVKDDILTGNGGADTLKGDAGVDVIYGGSGGDLLEGGLGADLLFGGAGSDTASYAGAGAAVRLFLDNAHAAYRTGDAQGDSYDAIENLVGSAHADFIVGNSDDSSFDGGAGDDAIFGGGGDDSYELAIGSGSDTIIDRLFTMSEVTNPDGSVTGSPVIAAGDAGVDAIELGSGLSLSNLSFVRSGNDLEVRLSASDRSVVKDFYAGPDGVIEALLFADGLSVNLAAIRLPGETATIGVDFLAGDAAVNQLDGLAGNDVISGGPGDDQLSGGVGDDILEGGAGGDRLDGGSDSTAIGPPAPDQSEYGDSIRYASSTGGVTIDLASGQASGGDATGDILVGIENVVGSALGDTIVGNDRANRLFGLDGNDSLTGLGGDDVLVGAGGGDVLDGGLGHDNLAGGDGLDTLRGGEGDDILDGGDERDHLYGGSGDDRLSGGGGDDALLDGGEGSDVLTGGDGSDRLEGGLGADMLDAGAGNDMLLGGDGNDTLSGGTGSDTADGGAGNDTYTFNATSGDDTLEDRLGVNRILIEGVAPEQLWLTRSGDNLEISVIGGASRILVGDYFSASSPTSIREIATATHSIFLQYAGGLIDAMTAVAIPLSASAVPTNIREAGEQLWWAGGKAVPLVMTQNVTTAEDAPLAGTISAVDHDGNITGYALKKSASHGTVALNATSGAWAYTPNASFSGSDGFSVSVTDADGHVVEALVNVVVSAINDQPVFAADQPALSVDENEDVGFAIATLLATDPEGETVAFSIVDPNSPFKISTGGALSVRDGLLLDYENARTASVTVRIADSLTTPVDRVFVVEIRPVNEAPYSPIFNGTALARASEGALGGVVITSFSLSDPDANATLSLRPASDSPAMFATSGTNLVFAADYNPDYENIAAGRPYFDRDGDGLREIDLVASVEAWDGFLASDAVTSVIVSIEDVNEAPTAIAYTSPATTPAIVERDRPASTAPIPLPAMFLATLITTDPDLAGPTGESHVYSVGDNRFEIVNGNQLQLKQGAALDYETAFVEAGTGRRYIEVAVTSRDRAGTGLSITRTLQVTVTDADDYHYGGLGNDIITGAAGRDIIFASGGNDTLSGGAGHDELSGEAGSDTLRGGVGNDTLYGGTEADTLYGEEGDDALHGNDGHDRLEGGAGADQLFGHADNDELFGGDGADLLEGGFGDDYLDGGSDLSPDTLRGGAGADVLLGGAGDDAIDGGDGDDRLNGGAGGDRIEGGLGIDTAVYASSLLGVSVYLSGSAPNATGDAQGDILTGVENLVGSGSADTLVGDSSSNWIEGGGGGDWLQGEGGEDALHGQAGSDSLHGMDGRDTLDGGADADTLNGGAGNDILIGGTGNDTLIGGSGDDAYMFVRGDGTDVIDQTGALAGVDKDVIGFDGLTRENLWFRWDADHLVVDVLGTANLDGSVRLKDFRTADLDQRANIRTVFATQDKTVDLMLGEFATAMGQYSQLLGYTPTTQAQFNSLRSNTTLLVDGRTFEQTWTNYWTSNEAPKITFDDPTHLASGYGEDSAAKTLAFNVEESNVVEFWVRTVASNGSMTQTSGPVDVAHTPIGAAGGAGTITATPALNKSGESWLWLHAKDAGGLVTDRWVKVLVTPSADKPTVSGSGGSGNAGTEIALTVGAQLVDTDSEYISAVEISNVPTGFSFKDAANSISAGANNLGSGRWRFSQAQLQGLKIIAPVGWSQNLANASALSVVAFSQETAGGAPAASEPISLNVNINAAPTSISLSIAAVDENRPVGTPVGVLQASDPDRLENNPFNLATASIIEAESRWIQNTPGPLGGTVTALQTGQFNNENGGGAFSSQFTVDPTRTYKFTVYLRADSAADTRVYFGLSTGGYVEHAATGADDGNPYFMYPVQNTLVPGRWYRFEGYVLPKGSPLVPDGLFGGIYDTVSGQKVGEATTFRWNDTMPSNSVQGRFFDYYGSPQGFATSWYEPVIEQMPTFTHLSGSGFTVDGATGLVRLATSPDYEETSSLPLQVRASDPGGLALDTVLTVAVTPVNEAPNAPVGSAREYFSETGLGSRPANANVVVASYELKDPDRTTPSLVLTSNPNDWFRTDGNRVLIKAGLNFDFEWARNQGYAIGDRNGNGIQDALVATIGVAASDAFNPVSSSIYTEFLVEDVEEDPVNLGADRELSFSEATGAGGIAWFAATDPDADGPIAYAIIDGLDGGGRFALRSDGLLSTTGVPLDYEGATSHTIRVRATDTGGRSIVRDFAIGVVDANERPYNLVLEQQNPFSETTGAASHAGQLIARFTMRDRDNTTPGLVILGGNDHNWFQTSGGNHLAFTSANFTADWLHSNMGMHGIDAAYSYDNDADGIPEVRVATLSLAAQDAQGARSDPFSYSVFIEDANEAPSITTDALPAVSENAPGAGVTTIGTLGWTDPDAAGAFRNPRFAITGGNEGTVFTVDAVSGVVSLQGSLNFETRSRYDLTFSITDAGGLSTSRTVAIPVSNANEAPSPTSYGNRFGSVIATNTIVGRVTHNDPDAEDANRITYTITSVFNEDLGNGNPAYYYVDQEGYVRTTRTMGGGSWQNHENITVEVKDPTNPPASTTLVVVYKSSAPRPPVVIDLDGDGVELTSVVGSTVRFDMDNDGIKDQTGWVAADDGLLVLDRDDNGSIDKLDEISFALDLAGATSDLEGLRAFDTNANGFFDKADREFAKFQVWKDSNQDGTNQAGELKSLADWGITSIDLRGVETGQVVEGATDNVLFATSKFYRANGSSGNVGDAFFAYYGATDLDKQGKLKAGKKAKYAGVDESQPLPEKLTKKSLKDSGASLQGDDDEELTRKKVKEFTTAAATTSTASFTGATELQSMKSHLSSGEAVLSDAGSSLEEPIEAMPGEIGHRASTPSLPNSGEAAPVLRTAAPPVSSDAELLLSVRKKSMPARADDHAAEPDRGNASTRPSAAAPSLSGDAEATLPGQQIGATAASYGDLLEPSTGRERVDPEEAEPSDTAPATSIAVSTTDRFANPLDKAIALLSQTAASPASIAMGGQMVGPFQRMGYGPSIRPEELAGDVVLDRLVSAMAALQSGQNVGTGQLRSASAAEGTLLTLAASG